MKLIVLLFASLAAFAQVQEYSVTQDITSTSAVITIQQPATGGKHVKGLDATIFSTLAFDILVERNGTAATTTSATLNPVASSATPAVTAFTASNVGAGTVIARYSFAANSSITIDLDSLRHSGNGTTKNFTVRTTPTSSARIVSVVRVAESDTPFPPR